MRIAVVTCDGFNEIDSFVSSYILNRMGAPGWRAEITSPSPEVVSRNGVRVTAQRPLEFANEADVVLFGSGSRSPELARDPALLSRLRLDPSSPRAWAGRPRRRRWSTRRPSAKPGSSSPGSWTWSSGTSSRTRR